VIAIYSTFIQRAFDQILQDVCLQNLPVVFALDRAGIVGEDGPTHHGLFDLSYMRAMPNMTITVPKDENELRRMLVLALNHNGPITVRYPRGQGLGVPLEKEINSLVIGQGEELIPGKDILILAVGTMVHPAVQAAETLAADGVEANVINARFVKPLDRDLILDRARTAGRVLCVEENTILGGFGSAVSELLSDHGLANIRVKRLGIPDVFIEHGTQAELRRDIGLDSSGIHKAAFELLKHQ